MDWQLSAAEPMACGTLLMVDFQARSWYRSLSPGGICAYIDDVYDSREENDMKVSQILTAKKGGTLFTVSSDIALSDAIKTMAEKDIGSLVVMDHGDLVGMLTFREVIQAVVRNGGMVGSLIVRTVMDDSPLTCTPDTDMDEVRRMMLGRHARYLPVMTQRTLMGVISFYDVAKAVVDTQDFENRMLKAYIRDWPAEDTAPAAAEAGGSPAT
jgi:CBS domain-containing protein